MIRKTLINPNDDSFIKKKCDNCKVDYWEKRYFANRYKHGYCSRECQWRDKTLIRSKEKSHLWKGGRIEHGYYIFIKLGKGVPGTDSQGYAREHRLVMEKHLGRLLNKDEDVHHINGIKTDNRIENLVVLTKTIHHKLHRTGVKVSPEVIKNMKKAQNNRGKLWLKRLSVAMTRKHKEFPGFNKQKEVLIQQAGKNAKKS